MRKSRRRSWCWVRISYMKTFLILGLFLSACGLAYAEKLSFHTTSLVGFDKHEKKLVEIKLLPNGLVSLQETGMQTAEVIEAKKVPTEDLEIWDLGKGRNITSYDGMSTESLSNDFTYFSYKSATGPEIRLLPNVELRAK